MNAYEMLQLLRDNIGESVEKHWTDRLLLRRLNLAKDAIVARVANSPGDLLLKKSASITPSSDRLALPADCLFPAYVETVSNGDIIAIRGTVRERRGGRMVTGLSYSDSVEAYLIGDYVEVNQAGFAEPCYIWYQGRVVDMNAGVCAAATDATHVGFELDHYPSGTDDYYNGVVVEVRDVTSHVLNVSTAITDYVGSTGVAEVASVIATPAAGDYYGTVCSLPQETHDWIVLKATVSALARPSSVFEKEIFSFWRSELKKTEDEMDTFLVSRLNNSTYVREVDR